MPYPQGLENMFFGPIGGDFAVEQFNQANQADKLSNQKSLQDIMFAQQDQPFKNQLLQSQARNTNALADQTELGNQFTRETWDSKTKAAVSKFLQEVDDNQLKSTMNKLERDMMSPDPQVRSEAQGLYGLTKEMVRMREEEGLKHKNKMSEIGATNAGQKELEQMRINAGKYNKISGKAALTIEQRILAAKSAKERHQMLLDAAEMARQAGDQEAFANYSMRAEVIRPQAEAELQATQRPGDVQVDRATQGRVPIAPPRDISPQRHSGTVGEGVTKNPAAQQMTMQQLQQMYPGVPPDKLREAFKRKFGIDVQ